MTNMKKRVFISSLALAMVTTSASFVMHRIHGEGEEAVVVIPDEPKKKVIVAKKALLNAGGTVTGRGEDDATDNETITELQTITDLLVHKDVTEVPAEKFNGLENLTKLAFQAAAAPIVDGGNLSQVTSIGTNAFKGTGLTNVVFPKNLSTINEGAFAEIPALTTVSFANSKNLETIGTGAFENSGLTSLDLSPMNESTKMTLTVNRNAFKGNKKLTNVTLSTKMARLGIKTFAATNITTIEIVKGIAEVNSFAFKETPLANLTVNSENTTFTADANVLYKKDKTSLYLYPEGKTDPNFTVPDSVTYIGPNAFSSSPYLTKVIVGQGLAEIGQSAFEDTKKLITLDLRKAAALTTFETRAFYGSALSSMIIGENTGALSTIDRDAFDRTTRKQVSFLDDENQAIAEDKLTALVEKYQAFKETANGAWELNAKFSEPNAVADYETMKLTGLKASTPYIIAGTEYTSDSDGNMNLIKAWGGKTIPIVRKATTTQDASDAQNLKIDGIFSLTIDGIEHLKKGEASVTVHAPDKKGHVFTKWLSTDVTLSSSNEKNVTFTMPSHDVTLETKYTEIMVETPTKDLIFDGKKDVVVTINVALSNLKK